MKSKIRIIFALLILFCITIISCSSLELGLNILDNVKDVYDTVEEISENIKPFLRNDFTEQDRYYVGRTTCAYIFTKHNIYEDEKLIKYINEIGQTIAIASDKSSVYNGYRFLPIEDSHPNAYATPGGVILISLGMIRMCDNEDEFAAVLAHEVEHIVKDHPMKMVDKSTKKTALINIAKITANKVGEEIGDNISYSTGEIIKGLSENLGNIADDIIDGLSNGYERKTEFEADAGAVLTLHNAGYCADALKDIIRKLPDSKNKSIYGSNHPSKNDRIDAVNKIIKDNSINTYKISNNRTKRFNRVMDMTGIK